jgi:hypothetical protein
MSRCKVEPFIEVSMVSIRYFESTNGIRLTCQHCGESVKTGFIVEHMADHGTEEKEDYGTDSHTYCDDCFATFVEPRLHDVIDMCNSLDRCKSEL